MSEPVVHADTLLEQAATIAAKEWGASQAGVCRLPGENLNYQCDVGVLKLSVEADCDPALEEAVQNILAKAGLPVPQSIPSRSGEALLSVELEGVQCPARMLRQLPGVQWRNEASSPELLGRIGGLVAQVHQALEGFDHPGFDRTHQWSLERAGIHRKSIPFIHDAHFRRAAERAFLLHAAIDLTGCARGMLHGDANDENILVDGDRITALLDFGDCLEGPLVADLAGLRVAARRSGPCAGRRHCCGLRRDSTVGPSGTAGAVSAHPGEIGGQRMHRRGAGGGRSGSCDLVFAPQFDAGRAPDVC